MMKKTALLYGFLALIAGPASSSDATPPSVRSSFLYGVNVHLGYNGNSYYASPQLAAAELTSLGATATRDDLVWGVMQASSPATLPAYMSHLSYSLTSINARPTLVLMGDTVKIPEGQPSDAASRAAFTAYAGWSALALKSVNPIFEIWNEWNMGSWNTKGNPSTPQNYVALAQAAYPGIKKHMPGGIVLAGAVGDDPNWAWTTAVIKAGVMNDADGFSVHMYNHCAAVPDRTGNNIIIRMQQLHALMQTLLPNRTVPLYITEFGWPNEDGQCGGVSEDAAADNVAQVLLWAPAFSWLKGAWLYELNDEGTDPSNREDHFGQYRADGTPKPSVCAASMAWQFIADYSFVSATQPAAGVEQVAYGKGLVRHVAIWQTDATQVHSVQIPSGASAISLCGAVVGIAGEWVPITQKPILITATSANESLIAVR